MSLQVTAQPNLFGLWVLFPETEEPTFPSEYVRLPIAAWVLNGTHSATPVPVFDRPECSRFEALELNWEGPVLWQQKRYQNAKEWFDDYRKIEHDIGPLT